MYKSNAASHSCEQAKVLTTASSLWTAHALGTTQISICRCHQHTLSTHHDHIPCKQHTSVSLQKLGSLLQSLPSIVHTPAV